jgi:hypothetical protein
MSTLKAEKEEMNAVEQDVVYVWYVACPHRELKVPPPCGNKTPPNPRRNSHITHTLHHLQLRPTQSPLLLSHLPQLPLQNLPTRVLRHSS